MLYSKSAELRAMFTETLNRVVTGGYIPHQPVKMIPSLDFKGPPKFKFNNKTTSEEAAFQKNLLLCMVRLIHADPMLLLNNQGKAGHEIQSATLELINGLVSLVHQPGMPEDAEKTYPFSVNLF